MFQIFLIDIGQAVLVCAAFFSLFIICIAAYVWRHNTTKLKTVAVLEVKTEIKAVLFSPVAYGIMTLALCTSMYMAESLVGAVTIGAVYLVFFVFMFKSNV